jgi:hypothetical protein
MCARASWERFTPLRARRLPRSNGGFCSSLRKGSSIRFRVPSRCHPFSGPRTSTSSPGNSPEAASEAHSTGIAAWIATGNFWLSWTEPKSNSQPCLLQENETASLRCIARPSRPWRRGPESTEQVLDPRCGSLDTTGTPGRGQPPAGGVSGGRKGRHGARKVAFLESDIPLVQGPQTCLGQVGIDSTVGQFQLSLQTVCFGKRVAWFNGERLREPNSAWSRNNRSARRRDL